MTSLSMPAVFPDLTKFAYVGIIRLLDLSEDPLPPYEIGIRVPLGVPSLGTYL